MIKNIYEPDNEDVLFWLAHNEKWPDPDWDLYVVNGKNDDLVFQLANDKACPEQEFFLHKGCIGERHRRNSPHTACVEQRNKHQ